MERVEEVLFVARQVVTIGAIAAAGWLLCEAAQLVNFHGEFYSRLFNL